MTESFRDRFVIDDPDLAYLDGNSLGRLPKAAQERIGELVEQEWGKSLIRGWNQNWLSLPNRLGDKIGQIIGAMPGETTVCDSTSTNLFKLATAMFHSIPGRNKIISDDQNFPSDLHILDGVAKSAPGGGEFQTVNLDGGTIDRSLEVLSQAIDESTALVSLSHVQYKSGRLFDLAKVTNLVHSRGARILWDLSHSVGALPIQLSEANVDAAVGCTYKYLNGGPGAPAFLFVRNDLIAELSNPIQGWFGSDQPFDFSPHYQPAAGISRFTVGTPPILSLAAIEPGIDLVLEAGIDRLRCRSTELGQHFIVAFDRQLERLGYSLMTPRDPESRGSHLSIQHPHGWQIVQDLIENHAVIPDFREPDVIRLGIAPLYTTLDEIEKAAEALQISVQTKSYQAFSLDRRGVT